MIDIAFPKRHESGGRALRERGPAEAERIGIGERREVRSRRAARIEQARLDRPVRIAAGDQGEAVRIDAHRRVGRTEGADQADVDPRTGRTAVDVDRPEERARKDRLEPAFPLFPNGPPAAPLARREVRIERRNVAPSHFDRVADLHAHRIVASRPDAAEGGDHQRAARLVERNVEVVEQTRRPEIEARPEGNPVRADHPAERGKLGDRDRDRRQEQVAPADEQPAVRRGGQSRHDVRDPAFLASAFVDPHRAGDRGSRGTEPARVDAENARSCTLFKDVSDGKTAVGKRRHLRKAAFAQVDLEPELAARRVEPLGRHSGGEIAALPDR